MTEELIETNVQLRLEEFLDIKFRKLGFSKEETRLIILDDWLSMPHDDFRKTIFLIKLREKIKVKKRVAEFRAALELAVKYR